MTQRDFLLLKNCRRMIILKEELLQVKKKFLQIYWGIVR